MRAASECCIPSMLCSSILTPLRQIKLQRRRQLHLRRCSLCSAVSAAGAISTGTAGLSCCIEPVGCCAFIVFATLRFVLMRCHRHWCKHHCASIAALPTRAALTTMNLAFHWQCRSLAFRSAAAVAAALMQAFYEQRQRVTLPCRTSCRRWRSGRCMRNRACCCCLSCHYCLSWLHVTVLLRVYLTIIIAVFTATATVAAAATAAAATAAHGLYAFSHGAV